MSESVIFLIEDNQDDIELTQHVFSQCQQKPAMVIAHDGEEALSYLLGDEDVGRAPDLVLLDLKLPGINGLEVLRQLRNSPRTRRLPIVILTTSDEESDIVSSYDLGVNSYIRKPATYSDFAQVADQLGMYWLTVNTPPPI